MFALVGTSNVELARSDRIGMRLVPPLVALLLVAVVLRVGQGKALEFIYFQF